MHIKRISTPSSTTHTTHMANIELSRYTVALVIISVFVLLYLTIVAIRMFAAPRTTMRRFPPWLSECPDFWVKDGDKCKPEPNNPNGRAVCSNHPNNHNEHVSWLVPSNLDYAQDEGVSFSNHSLRDRCKWAQACDVHWEGISDQSCTDQDHFHRYDGATIG